MPDGNRFVYNRVFREFRTWKRYRGGQTDEVWLHDFKTKTTTNLTNNPGQDIIPMWKGTKIYFASDRDERGRMNLYSFDLGTKQTKKLTNYTEFDVKFPSMVDTAIAFENGGWIYKLDLASERVEKVPVTIAEDFDSGRPSVIDVSRSITNYEIAPDGSRALFGARGDVFTVPAKNGPTRNLTVTPGVHERNSKWSPDGRWISYISDATGEDEIWIEPQDGKKMLVGQAARFAIIDTPTGKVELRDFLDLSDLKVTVDRHAEWRQMFNESWRQMRDFFYAPNMHGVDWPAMRRTYEPLIPSVNHRADLTYVIGEMIGELTTGHTIGKRTWGGVVGIRGALPMLDGGVLNRPEFSRYDVAGKAWAIEGVGVEPDIFVDNDPAKEYAGEDQQLDRAIVEIFALLKKQPGTLAPKPPYPVKR
jgi:dipeptidyl aminopeptidase/acylaminoacyl peptidase